MKLYTVDAFTSIPFKGNQAGVCVLEEAISDDKYLQIAAEINYAETAFVIPQDDEYHLRWFTPKTEVDLCGHATLATAKVLFDILGVSPEKVLKFNTRSGLLTVKKVGDLLEMDFPEGEIAEAVDENLQTVFKDLKVVFLGKKDSWSLIEIESEEDLKSFIPDVNLLLKQQSTNFMLTAKSTTTKYDFISRVFAPAIGLDEDAVTGSAHCYLAKYWSDKLGKNKLLAYQASERGGEIECELVQNNRVLLRGDAVVMSELKVFWDIRGGKSPKKKQQFFILKSIKYSLKAFLYLCVNNGRKRYPLQKSANRKKRAGS